MTAPTESRNALNSINILVRIRKGQDCSEVIPAPAEHGIWAGGPEQTITALAADESNSIVPFAEKIIVPGPPR